MRVRRAAWFGLLVLAAGASACSSDPRTGATAENDTTTQVSGPPLVIIQHINGAGVNSVDLMNQMFAVPAAPWQVMLTAAGGDLSPGGIAYKTSMLALLEGLVKSANPDSPYHFFGSSNLRCRDGNMHTGQNLDDYIATKEHRGYMQMSSFTITCDSSKNIVIGADNHATFTAEKRSDTGFTPVPTVHFEQPDVGPAGNAFYQGFRLGLGGLLPTQPPVPPIPVVDVHGQYLTGESMPGTGGSWNSVSIVANSTGGQGQGLAWRAGGYARLEYSLRAAQHLVTGTDAPFIFDDVTYTLNCDGSFTLDVSATNFPTITVYVGGMYLRERYQDGFGAFMLSGGSHLWDTNEATSATYPSYPIAPSSSVITWRSTVDSWYTDLVGTSSEANVRLETAGNGNASGSFNGNGSGSFNGNGSGNAPGGGTGISTGDCSPQASCFFDGVHPPCGAFANSKPARTTDTNFCDVSADAPGCMTPLPIPNSFSPVPNLGVMPSSATHVYDPNFSIGNGSQNGIYTSSSDTVGPPGCNPGVNCTTLNGVPL
jgi:hypothetical protein